jgi:3-hydroxybutyryl-CoA dehydratase
VGQKATLSRTVTYGDIGAFAELTGDTNPIHLDDDYAKKTRFGRRIAHGMLIGGFISAVLGTKLPGPGGILIEQTLRYLSPVYPGEALEITAEVVEYQQDKGVVVLKTTCCDSSGRELVTGRAVLKVPLQVH